MPIRWLLSADQPGGRLLYHSPPLGIAGGEVRRNEETAITARTADPVRTIRRPHLERRLRTAATRRLTALTAGPGFGKTTLLSQTFDSGSVVWHTVTPLDASLPVFALNVVERIRLRVPGMAADLRTVIEGPTGPDLADEGGRVEALAATLAHELDTQLVRDLILIVDDVHELEPDGASARFLGALCRNAPPRLHIVTASRATLPFPTARMRLSQDTDELTATDLAFAPEEVSELMSIVMGRADDKQVATLVERTEGWPVAIMMMLRSPSQGGGDGNNDFTGADALFDYLAEELFANEQPETIEVLTAAAEVPWVSGELLKRLGVYAKELDRFDFDRAHPYLTRQPDAPHAAVISPLIGEFLLRRRPLADDRRHQILIEGARWYLENGHLAEALICHHRLGPSEESIRLLDERGESLLSSGLARHVLPLIEDLGDHPERGDVLLLEAEARQILGDWEGAMRVYRKLEPTTHSIPPRLAWRLGFLQHMRGDVMGALETYQRGELGTGDITNESALLGWMASAHWLRGERDQAKLLADQALGLALKADASQALATAHTVLAMVAALDGDRATNDIHYLRALEHAEKARDVLQTIRIRSNRGSRFLEEGDFEPALEELEIALRLADMTGFELWRGMALSNRAQIAAYQGRLEEAINDLRQARSIFRSIGSSLETYPLTHLGAVYAVRGDTAMAIASFEEVIRVADAQSDLQALVPALTGLARLIAKEDPDRAETLARRAGAVHSVIGRVTALVALGEVALARGEHATAARHAEEAGDLARSRNDLPGLAEALELAARTTTDSAEALRLLEQARQVWSDVGAPIGVSRVDVRIADHTGGAAGIALATRTAESLEGLGAKGLALEARRVVEYLSSAEIDTVSIRTLGGFEVMVGGERVPGSAWQSRVAREVLCMLVANRWRPIHREMLMERLWPDQDPVKSANRLSVALATVRRVLDPDKEGETGHLRSDREVVALSPDDLDVDVERFFEDANQGRSMIRAGKKEQGLALLASAESRYVGDFLEDQPFAEWAIGLREEARSMYVAIASTLAEADLESGDFDSAARRYLRILERDPYNETTHLRLITVMARSGRHGTARRLYSVYVSRMTELDVEPQAFPF